LLLSREGEPVLGYAFEGRGSGRSRDRPKPSLRAQAGPTRGRLSSTCCRAIVTARSAWSLVRLLAAALMAQTEVYLVVTAMSSMKHDPKEIPTRMMLYAAGERWTPHMANILATR